MYWIALCPSREDERTAWGWRALRYTPRVAAVEEALLLEVSTCERLWGGRRRLLKQLLGKSDVLSAATWADGDTSLIALAKLRSQMQGRDLPAKVPDDLSLELLSQAAEHVATLERVGCRTWGQLSELPRAGVSRRFGAVLVDALDRAYGQQPETYDWLTLPEDFDMKVELTALATSAPELMWTAQRLLSQLQVWLQSRNRGVLALELEWTLDLRRIDGKPLPPSEMLEVRTAQPTQDMAHLRKLVNEHLTRTPISAPANHLRLRSLETTPWGGRTTSLLPEDNKKGEALHQLVERLSVRLGENNVLVPQMLQDHRPEKMQRWVPARHNTSQPNPETSPDALYPPWLLKRPIELEVRNNVPHYQGPLRRPVRLYRIETGWWDEGKPVFRDYFIARSERAGLVWVFRERPVAGGQARWFLQGLYA
ncbi:Y-family DNA polymerase [Ramlibacter albus]|uniref:DNA polymerase Y family protein n=1 Tax=Ramlibacter albus TaxID=2079448 RepID=A0A923S6S9_9BURK|nr:DNA polymerase Y family protein [Ramlibacter albus]MBC5766462.1 DNA polymerase Y family protein [Ramlibacter albus]